MCRRLFYTTLLPPSCPNSTQSSIWTPRAMCSLHANLQLSPTAWLTTAPQNNNYTAQMWIISAWTRTNFSENCTYCRTNWVCYGRSQNNCSGDCRAYPAVNSLFVPARSQDRNSRQGSSKQGTNSSVWGSICSDKGLLPSRQGCKTPLQALTSGKIGGSSFTAALQLSDKMCEPSVPIAVTWTQTNAVLWASPPQHQGLEGRSHLGSGARPRRAEKEQQQEDTANKQPHQRHGTAGAPIATPHAPRDAALCSPTSTSLWDVSPLFTWPWAQQGVSKVWIFVCLVCSHWIYYNILF